MDLLREVRGCTFDDLLLAPQCSIVDRRDPASARSVVPALSQRLTLRRPIVSANMDTVTRAADGHGAWRRKGGIGIIDRGFRPGDIEPQVREVRERQADAARRDLRSDDHRAGHSRWRRRPALHGALARRHARRRRRATSWRGLLTERDLRFVDAPESRVADRA